MFAPVRLNVGDSIYFDSAIGHAYLAASDGPCRVLSICTGREAQLIAAGEKQQSADSSPALIVRRATAG
jgi:hypothetical protein